jgi:hypothetical protein
MKRGKPARGSPLPRSGPGYSGPAACLSSSLPSKVTYPSYESRDKVLAGLQSTIPSGAGIRGPLHPRRLRCPPSPYHRGVRLGRAHRRTGRIMPLVRLRSPHRQGSKRFGATADDPPQPWRRRMILCPLAANSVRRNSPGTFLIHLRDAGEECPRPRCAEPPLCLLARESCTEQFPYYL